MTILGALRRYSNAVGGCSVARWGNRYEDTKWTCGNYPDQLSSALKIGLHVVTLTTNCGTRAAGDSWTFMADNFAICARFTGSKDSCDSNALIHNGRVDWAREL